MTGVLRRMNKLKALFEMRHGPGAALLPADVTRIHMEFAQRNNGGHMGPRKFWRENLRRLKYWNPSVPMVVNRTSDQDGPARMTLYFADQAANAAAAARAGGEAVTSSHGQPRAPEPGPGERTVTINMKMQHSSAILKDFLDKTGAVPVVPTAQELEEMRDLEELRLRGEADRERVRRALEAQRREAALISQARNEAAALKAAAQ